MTGTIIIVLIFLIAASGLGMVMLVIGGSISGLHKVKELEIQHKYYTEETYK